jgi:hypothetical protein
MDYLEVHQFLGPLVVMLGVAKLWFAPLPVIVSFRSQRVSNNWSASPDIL